MTTPATPTAPVQNGSTQNAATKPRSIDIAGMTGEACIQKVIGALRNVSGVTIDSVTVGHATVTCAYPAAYSAACAAITSAGYRATAPVPAAGAACGTGAAKDCGKTDAQPIHEGAHAVMGGFPSEGKSEDADAKGPIPVAV